MTIEDKRMIPLSVVDALIAECQLNYEQLKDNPDTIIKVEARMFELFIQHLRGLEKKEAIPSPDLEQKIQEINELIAWNLTPSCNEAKKKLDELRKLLK